MPRRPLCTCGHSYSCHRGDTSKHHEKGACKAVRVVPSEQHYGYVDDPCACTEYRPAAPAVVRDVPVTVAPRRHRSQQVADALREFVLGFTQASAKPGASAIMSITPDELLALIGKPGETAASAVLFVEEHLGKIWAHLPVGWTLARARGVYAVTITRRQAERVAKPTFPTPPAAEAATA